MVGRDLSTQAMPFDTVDQYLRSLGSRLQGPARVRSAILEEIRAELGDAINARTSPGESSLAASRSAVAELGSPEMVAAAFAGELATVRARHVLWSLLLTGPLVGVWWFLILVPTHLAPRLGLFLAAIPVLPLIGAAVGTAVVTLATTGSLIRWLPEVLPARALTAAIAVTLVCMISDVSVLMTLLLHVVTASAGSYPLVLVGLALTASVLRLIVSAWAIRLCLQSRKALRTAA